LQELRLVAGALTTLLAVAALAGAAGEARAVDCGKASNRFDKAICADPKSRAANEALNKAFDDLTASVDAEQRATITGAEVVWLGDRNAACEQAKADELSSCLARETNYRRMFLTGQTQQGPGAPGRIVPWFRFEKGGIGKVAINMELLKFADPKTPGERAFNEAAMKPLDYVFQPNNGSTSDHYAFDTRMWLTYASPKFVSAGIWVYVFGDTEHPNTSGTNINLDVAAGRIAKFEDAFDAASAEKIFKICIEQVKAAKKERARFNGWGDELETVELNQLNRGVRDVTGDLGNWSFSGSQAVISYDPYVAGAYIEGAYRCRLDYRLLRPLVQPSFPLP
jgi:uncharacterized protein YecT (DUF1311 family)